MSKGFIKNLIPISIVIAGLLIAGVLIYLNQGKVTEEVSEGLSPQQVAEKAIDYITQNILAEGLTASLISVAEENGVYKIHLKIGEEEYDSYATKDGKFLFPEGYNLEETPTAQNTEDESPQPSTEGSISSEELAKFVGCLEKADFVIYGANWCSWTKKLVEMLGGWDMVKPIYIECTEETELCEEKEISGYPTIFVRGERYQGSRTFEGFAAATDCDVSVGAESVTGESPSGGCQ